MHLGLDVGIAKAREHGIADISVTGVAWKQIVRIAAESQVDLVHRDGSQSIFVRGDDDHE